MGCSQSKIENEEAVTRCRDRKRFMKDAVTARNAFAAAHSSYLMAVKNTGAALSDYAHGEVELEKAPLTKPPIFETLPPPPPLPDFPPPPLQRATSMPDLPIPISKATHEATIQEGEEEEEEEEEEEDDDDDDDDDDHDEVELEQRGHVGVGVGGGGGYSREQSSRTASPPPPPPVLPSPSPPSHTVPPPPVPQPTTWDYFFQTDEILVGTNLNKPPPEEEEKKPTKQEDHDLVFKGEEKDRHVHVVPDQVTPPEKVIENTATAAKMVKKQKQQSVGSSSSSSSSSSNQQHIVASSEQQSKKVGVQGPSLLQIFSELDDHFLKASQSAHEVSKMLEANRLHYHSNFADNRGHIDHSARVMRVITWNRSFRGMSNADDSQDELEQEEFESHATVLDKLLAWEKKLYDEVKEGEHMKIDYQRKVALLNKQKKRSTNPEAIEKAKVAVSHLHTRYIVDIQSMDSTVTEIHRLRDDQLYPKLVHLVDGMAKMWEAMYANHNVQHKIVADIRSLDISNAPKETSEHHHKRTIQLLSIANEWRHQSEKLMSHQKEYIQALNSWLRVNLVPIESNLREKVSSPPRVTQPRIQDLLQAWNDHLAKIPDGLARNAIGSFAAVIDSIVMHQEVELKQKYKCEELKKELHRKAKAFDEWNQKYLQRREAAEAADPERTTEVSNTKEDQLLLDKQVAVEALRKKYDEEVEAHDKVCRQVREKSLASLKTHLPELFRAMSDFSRACSESYKKLHAVDPLVPNHH